MRRPWIVNTRDSLPARSGRGTFTREKAQFCCDRINAIWKQFGVEANARVVELEELRSKKGPVWSIVSDLRFEVPKVM